MGELIIADFKNKSKSKKRTYEDAMLDRDKEDVSLKERLDRIQGSVNRINALITELKTCGGKKHLSDVELDIILHDI